MAGNTGTAALSFTFTTALSAPMAPQPSQSGDIVGLLLKNTGTGVEKSGYATFGKVFESGDVMPGDRLVARINGLAYAVQMDVKTTNSDGSVRQCGPNPERTGNCTGRHCRGDASERQRSNAVAGCAKRFGPIDERL